MPPLSLWLGIVINIIASKTKNIKIHTEEVKQMKNDDDLLAEELGKIGKFGGNIGAALSGNPLLGKAAGIGGYLGASITTNFLPTESCTEKINLNVSADEGIKAGYSVLQKLGELKSDESSKAPYPFLKAVIGSGFFNMNPAVLYYEILNGDSNSCEITITAAAKEGLIKQHTAKKAVKKVKSALNTIINLA